MMASLMAGNAATGSACAPPRGSGMMVSITPRRTSSGAVMRSASVAWRAAGRGGVWLRCARRVACEGQAAARRPRGAARRAPRCAPRSRPQRKTHRARRVAGLPEDGGARLGRGHVVHRVLHDEVAVGAADGERAAAAALADDHGDEGHAEAKHLAQVVGDGLALGGGGVGARSGVGWRGRGQGGGDAAAAAAGAGPGPQAVLVAAPARQPDVPLPARAPPTRTWPSSSAARPA
jgi:hypothetical protein